ncbi:integrase arm-type DNA-binding domain-containing protein [Vibrio splendidus]|uniref:integrase arm-type DNA-binding domain-containing protein n=1 Tax=Vibrio splendidus TaxID=29497 RepID=UPI00076AA748|nr:integrase arm-type DNA-binding domain-containing protein [Vibrio splendidus]
MAKKVQPLTATQIKQAKPKEKEYNLGDGDGLSLKIKPIGTKLWRFSYYHPISRKRLNLALGKYPDISLAKARTKAIEARELLADGIDPKEHRDNTLRTKQLELANTLQAVFDDWIEVKKTSVKEQTAKKLKQRIEKYLLPDLGKFPLGDITAPQAIKTIKPITRCLLEWQLHTMTRPTETAGARWDEIDKEKMLWVIPAERMKKGRVHTVPLTKQTLDLLETINFITGDSEYLFPADKSNKNHINKETANKALVRMGMKGRQTSHGLRALASTTLNELDFEPDIIEAALSHVDGDKVRSAYNRTDYLERRKVLMTWWSDHIEEAAKGSLSMSGKKSLKVVG